MIAHVRGRVTHRDTGTVVVDVNGVGYLVHVASLDRVPPRGEPVELHTSLQVREDSMTLYGFADRDGLDLFEILIGSSGVGPKLALAALRTHRTDLLRGAIATGDIGTLTAVPGIGKKVAERLVLELRDKVGLPFDTADTSGDTGIATTPLGEVREALAGLGYSAGEIQAAMADLDGDGDTSELLRRALRSLGSMAVGGGR